MNYDVVWLELEVWVKATALQQYGTGSNSMSFYQLLTTVALLGQAGSQTNVVTFCQFAKGAKCETVAIKQEIDHRFNRYLL